MNKHALYSSILFLIIFISSDIYGRGSEYNNQFYLKTGYTYPLNNSYGGTKDQLESIFDGEFSRVGGNFQMGSMFFINRHLVRNNTCFGFNIDYISLAYAQFKNSNPDYLNWNSHYFFSSNVGPMLTYSSYGIWFIDLYAKANLAWLTALYEIHEYPNHDGDKLHDETLYIDDFSLRYSIGLNYRYRYFIAGIEYSTGAHKLLETNTEDEYYPGFTGDDKTLLPFVSVQVGISF